MTYKICNYSQEKLLTKLSASELSGQFEFIDGSEMLAEDVLKQNFDVIEMVGRDYEAFKPHVKAVDWKTNQIGMADCLIRAGNTYRPHNLLAEVLLAIIKKNTARINSQLPVFIIGDFHFVMSVATQLVLSGFIEIVISLTEGEDDTLAEEIEKKLRIFAFNLNIKFVNINELTTVEQSGFLLISDFKKELNKEAYELLTYFNFLSEGALFIDCNSIIDHFLVDDARKAEIAVIDETQVINSKYQHLLNLLKISPKV